MECTGQSGDNGEPLSPRILLPSIAYPESPRIMTLSSTFFLDVIARQLQAQKKRKRKQKLEFSNYKLFKYDI